MNLKLFFSPLNDDVYSGITSQSAFYKSIVAYEESLPDYRGADIAIIGLTEVRGAAHESGVDKGADLIRQKLYQLKKGYGQYKIVDMGNLRPGISLEETHLRIKEVCQALILHNVLPVLIGGSQDMDYGQFMAYDGLDKLISLLNVDAFLDINEDKNAAFERQHIHKILLHEPNYLFNYSHLAYQTYLIDANVLAMLEKLYFEAYRVGHLRANMTEMEPIIRNADMLTFDTAAIKVSDAPGTANAQPFGLTGEEACQVCWYAGLNEKLSSAGFYGYSPEFDDDRKKTASVLATMVWYFIEGFYHRKNEQNFKNNDYLKFVVSMPSEPEVLHFYKSNVSEKWWLEVPYPSGKEKYARNCIVPCSYSDYQMATKGELPERYIATHAKLL